MTTSDPAPGPSALSRLTTVALGCAGAMFLGVLWLTGGIDPDHLEVDLLVFSALLLGSAAIAVTRLRWAPLPGSLVAIALTVVSPFFQPFTRYHLAHPEQFTFFAATLLLHGIGLVAGAAGLAATWQNYRSGRAPARRWAAFILTAVTGVVAGALVVGLVTAADTSTTVSTDAPGQAAVPFVAGDLVYSQAPARVPAGAVAITLDNRGAVEHNVAFDGGKPIVAAAAGATASGTVTLEPGTHTYFCTVPGHREAGMEGQVQAGG